MHFRTRPRRTLIAVLVAALLTALAATATGPAQADPAQGVAFGTITFPHHDSPKVKVLWFTKDWSYVGTANANGGTYYLTLAPGTYWLQFVDQRATYHTDKYAPSNIKVTVRSGASTKKNVKMTKGAFITGTVKAHGKRAKKAEVIAANASEQSYRTTANKKGQFAIGGLPAGTYSVFSYDHKHAWVDKSTYAGGLNAGQSANLAINLRTKAGSLRVALFTSNGPVSGHPVVTAVSKRTGQFWSEKVKGGSALFQGLYPGKYKLVANGFGVWFGKTGAIKGAKVKSGRADFGQFTYTKRGGWVTGDLVDGGNTDYPLKKAYSSSTGAKVDLYSSTGALLGTGYSDDDGHFTIQGQIPTESGTTLVVTPSPDSGGYMNGEGYCQYDGTTLAPVSITVSRQTEVGSIPVPRHPDQSNPACMSS